MRVVIIFRKYIWCYKQPDGWVLRFFLPFYSRGFLTTRSIFAFQHSCYPSRFPKISMWHVIAMLGHIQFYFLYPVYTLSIVRVQIRVQWVKLLRTVVKLRRYIICGYSWCATVCRAVFVAGLMVLSFPHMYETPGAEKIQPETVSTGSELDDSKNMDQESPGSRSIFVYALYSFNNLASFYDRCNVHVRLRHPLALPLSLSPHRHPFCIFPPSSLFYPLLW
jgi:hypothetical protein